MGWLVQDTFAGRAADGSPAVPWTAPADLEKTHDPYLVEIDVPQPALNLEVSDNLLRISGKIKDRERTGVLHSKGRRVGRFEHILAVPWGRRRPGQRRSRRSGY